MKNSRGATRVLATIDDAGFYSADTTFWPWPDGKRTGFPFGAADRRKERKARNLRKAMNKRKRQARARTGRR
jgi:hypothetical protein